MKPKPRPEAQSISERPRRWAYVLTPAVLFVLALAIRVLPWPTVIRPDGLYPIDHDVYYHLRRIQYALAHFPTILDFDPYLNFPAGARPIWSPAFDLLLSVLAYPFRGFCNEVEIEHLLAWVPPVLGAMTVLVVYRLALGFFGFSVAVVAGFSLAILSGHFWYTQIGFVDHHVAVALGGALLLLSSMRLVQRLSTAEAAEWMPNRASVVVGILLGAVLLIWPGALLHVSIVEGVFAVFSATRTSRAAAHRAAVAFATSNAVAAVLILLLGRSAPWPQWNAFSPVVLSHFQPWLFLCLTLFHTGCAVLWRGVGRRDSVQARLLQSAGLGLLLLAGSGAAAPGLLEGSGDAWGWLTKGERFQAMVEESVPLFSVNGRFGTQVAELRLSRFVYLAPLALGALAVSASRRRDGAALYLFVAWTSVFGIVTLLQKRFFVCFAVALAILLGWAFHETARQLNRWTGSTRGMRRRAVQIGLATVFAFLFWPVLDAYRLPLQNNLEALEGRPLTLPPARHQDRALVATARWLRENTPETSGFLDPEGKPEYAVLAMWGRGHVIEYRGRRPTIVTNFGDDLGGENFAKSLAYFTATDEDVAASIGDSLGVRFVVTQQNPPVVAPTPGTRSLMARLQEDDGRGMTRHRLVYEASYPDVPSGGGPAPFKVFQLVPGAWIEGEAVPGDTVVARLGYITNRGRRGEYRATSRASADGRYAIRVPYATHGVQSVVRVDPEYRLEAGGEQQRISVEEEAVQAGVTLRGPDFPRRRP
ncbi:MAG TPA: STT3 domain-containing protein [Myxococcota bacterium]|nr:STT3 domain-containing protein [Myxococcota bacterium]